jgi:RHS repeat-associated protein
MGRRWLRKTTGPCARMRTYSLRRLLLAAPLIVLFGLLVASAAQASPPANTALPAVSGLTAQGNVLTASTGTWSNSPTSYGYQWRRCDATGYSGVALSDSPVAYWRLEESSTSSAAADSSGFGNAGSYNGGLTLSQSGPISTETDHAATFDGSSGYVSAPNSTSLNQPTSAITLEAWIKPTDYVNEPVILKSYTSHTDPYYQYGLFQFYDEVRLDLSLGDVRYMFVSTGGITTGVWNYIVATWDGSTVRFYVNGTAVGTGSASGTISTYSTPVTLGTYENLRSSPYYFWGGKLDEAAIYPTALSAARIAAHYAAATSAAAGSCTDISGATGSTYALTSSDVGHMMKVVVTATNADGSASATSNASTTVLPLPTPENTALPTVTGTVAIGNTLTATTGTWTSSPSSYAYQWQRCNPIGSSCTDISGATASTRVVATTDAGHRLRVVVTATNANGSASANSGVTAFLYSETSSTGYRDLVQAEDPVGYWGLGETGSSAADYGSHSHPGTYQSSSPNTLTRGANRGGRRGADNGSVQIKDDTNVDGGGTWGASDVSVSGPFAFTGTSSFSANIWLRWDGYRGWRTSSLTAGVIGSAAFGSDGSGWGVYVKGITGGSGPGFLAFRRGSSGNSNELLATHRLSPGDWTMVTVTYDGSTMRFYLNGKAAGSRSSSVSVGGSSSSGLLIGMLDFNAALSGYVAYFNGRMDEASVYDRALTSSEVQQQFEASRPIQANPLTLLGQGAMNAIKASMKRQDPVDTATGNFAYANTDAAAAATGVPFSFERSYNSTDATSGELGKRWVDTFAASLSIDSAGDVIARAGNGEQTNFWLQSNGSFEGDPGTLSTLEAVTGGYDLTTSDQITQHYNSTGQLQAIVDRNGQGLTLTYGTGGVLDTVTDADGRDYTFTHSSGMLTKLTLPDSSHVDFAYTGDKLTSVTDLRGKTWTYTYDTHGFLATETDPLSHTQFTNTFDTTGRVTEQLDALGNLTTFDWDEATQTETITDANGHEWKDVYDNNVLQQEVDPANHATNYTRDINLNNTSVSSPSGETTMMTYDDRGNLLSATAPASLNHAQKTYSYDNQNNVTSVTDANGDITTYTYDTDGNLTEVDLNNNQIAGYTYDTAGRKLTSTDANGKTTTYTYDTAGNVESVTDPLGDERTYTYDDRGRVLTKVDPLGNVSGGNPANHTTTYTYDDAGNLLTETDQLGHTTTKIYDDAGNLHTTTDANGHTTTDAYDANNHLTSVTGPDPDGAGSLVAPVTSYTYDDAGNKLTETDPDGNTTTYAYNNSNQLINTTTEEGSETTYTYDDDGNLATTVDPRGNETGATPADYTTSYTYDAAGRQLTVSDPLGHTTTTTYDDVGNRLSSTDANSHETDYTYDAQGHVLTVTAPDGGVTTYAYDGNGNVLTRTDDNGHTATNVYDDAGELVQTTGPDPDGTGSQSAPVTTYEYDVNGNLTATTDPNGNATATVGDGTTTRTYDRANRLTGIDYSDSTPDVGYTYDAGDNRTEMTDGAGTIDYTYDNLDRLTSTTRGGDTFSYAYDAANNVTSRTYPGSYTTTYVYDGDNRMTSATRGSATTAYEYDAAGNLRHTTLPSGNGYVETRVYDRASRVIEVKNSAGSSVLSEFSATLDHVGNPIEIDRTGTVTETSTYTYDANDRLTSVCYQASCPGSSDPFIRWTYDRVGNRLTEARPSGTTSYSYDHLDELTQAGSTALTYDRNGNEVSSGGTTYSYDQANRLTSVDDLMTTSYSYDGDGNRLRATSIAGDRSYLWDTNSLQQDVPQLAIERDAGGGLLRWYAYGERRIALIDASGSPSYYHYDLRDSVVDITSSAGATEWSYSYEPFGVTSAQVQNSSPAPANPFGFASEYQDDVGQYNLRAREYDPPTGRMLSTDPAPTPVGDLKLSTYSYVDDRPLVLSDPTGMTAQPSDRGSAGAHDATSRGTDDDIFRQPSPGGGSRSLLASPGGLVEPVVDYPHFSTTGFLLHGLHEYVVKGWWKLRLGGPANKTATLTVQLQWAPPNGGWLNIGRKGKRSVLSGPKNKVTAAASCTPGTTKVLRGRMDVNVDGAWDPPGYNYSPVLPVKCSRI